MLTASRLRCRRPCAPEAAHTLLRTQRGSLLLDASIAIVIFSFGVIGVIGVLASSIRAVDDAHLRTEAASVAHAVIAQMWTMSVDERDAQFAPGGPAFGMWQSRVEQLLPQATLSVEITEPGLSAQSRSIVVALTWLLPGSSERRRYVSSAQIGRNT